MTEIYTPEGIEKRRKRARAARRTALALGIVTLGAVVTLCLGVRTANALWRQWAAVAAAALGGAAALLIMECVAVPESREAEHEAGVLKEEPEEFRGRILSTGRLFRIPGSVAFLPVKTEAGEFRLNACWQKALPPAGTEVRGRAARKYIIALEGTEARLPSAEAGLRAGRSVKRICQLTSHVLALGLACALLVSWVFNLLTDTDRAHKVTLFAEVSAMAERETAAALEENLPEQIRMVKAHPFHYAMLDTAALETADLYLMTAGGAEERGKWLCPLPEGMRNGELLEKDGVTVGRLVYRAGTDSPLEKYLPEIRAAGQDLYLCFGKGGYHLSGLENGADDAALTVAETLLSLAGIDGIK